MKTAVTWIVVADASRARFFERYGAKAKLNELSERAMKADQPATPRDRPPRVHESMGAMRHIIEPKVTPRSAAQAHFLAKVANAINVAAEQGSFDKLTICAPPRALGLLRDGLSNVAKERVTAAIHKDYMHDNADALQAHLDALAS